MLEVAYGVTVVVRVPDERELAGGDSLDGAGDDSVALVDPRVPGGEEHDSDPGDHGLEGFFGVGDDRADPGWASVTVVDGEPVVPWFTGLDGQREEWLVLEVGEVDFVVLGEGVVCR